MSDVSTSADAGSAAVDSVAEPAAASQFAGAPILEVKDLAVSFGGIKAVNGLTFSVHEGEIVSVIGPNGAGKTSAFNCISGFYRPNQGSVVFDGSPITRNKPSRITQLGMARTFQNVRLFKSMTVLENLLVAQHTKHRPPPLSGLFNTKSYRRSEELKIHNALRWLDVMGLREYANREAVHCK